MSRILKTVLSCILLVTCVCVDMGPLPEVKPVREDVARHPLQLKIPVQEFKIPKPARDVLANGMPVYVLEDHNVPVITITAKFRAGMKYEPAGKYGLASLTSAVMESGGTTGMSADELLALFDNKRVEFAVTPGPDFISVSAVFLSSYADEIIPVFFDILRTPAFPAGVVANRKTLLKDALDRDNEQPGYASYSSFMKDTYKGHPYANNFLSTPESIDAVSREDITAFHYKYFRPNNGILGVAGDFSRPDILGMIAKECENWKPQPFELPAMPDLDRSADEFRILLLNRQLQQSYIIIGQPCISRCDNGYMPLLCLNTILGGCFSSRLVTKIRTEKGYAYSVDSNLLPFEDSGVFYAGIQTEAANTAKVIKLVLQELEDIRANMVQENELEFARDFLVNNFIFRFKTPGMAVSQFMDLELYDMDAGFYENYVDSIMRLSREDLLTAAKKYLTPDKLLISITGNKESFFDQLSTIGGITELGD